MSEFLKALGHSARQGSWDEYEELWLDAVEKESASFPEFLQAAQHALQVGCGDRAGKIFELLEPQANALGHKARRAYFETLVQCLPKLRPHRHALIDAYKEEFGDIEGFDTCVKASELKESKDPKVAIALFLRMIHFQPSCFVVHKSGWGVGEILRIDPVEGAAEIDFQEKPNHRVLLEALPDICKPLGKTHFLVLAWRNPEELHRLAAEEPIELIRKVLATSERPVPLARMREMLTESNVIPTPDWSKWWAKQRNAIKKEPSIGVGGGRSSEFFLLEGPEAVAKSVERRLEGLQFKQRLRVLRDLVEETSIEDRPVLQPHMEKLHRDLTRGDGGSEVRLEALLFLRREGGDLELPDVADMIREHDRLADAINTLTRIDDQKEIIDELRRNHPEEWPEYHVDLLLAADDGPREYLLELFEEAGRSGELDALADAVHRIPAKAPMFYLWLVRCASKGGHPLVPSLDGLAGADLFLQAISLLDRLSLQQESSKETAVEIRVKRFRQHIAGKPLALLRKILENATIGQARDIYLAFQGARGFSTGAQQRVLAAVLRAHPKVLAEHQGRAVVATLDENTIYSTDFGIAAKHSELEEIRNEKLPAIFKAIGDAAALGDLSENAEFTSAIEERENLNRRVMELQSQVDKSQRIDPSLANLEVANLGTQLKVTNLETKEQFDFALLGPWDGTPEVGVISYMSPIGKAVWQKKPGDEFEVELPSGTVSMRLDAIDRFKAGRPAAR